MNEELKMYLKYQLGKITIRELMEYLYSIKEENIEEWLITMSDNLDKFLLFEYNYIMN